MTDSSQIGIITAELMEQIDYIFEGKNIEIGTVAIVAEITFKTEDDIECNSIIYRCSDPRVWIQAGLFDQAARAAKG